MAELVDLGRLVAGLPVELVPLADDDDREVLAARVAVADLVAALVDRDRLLRDEDHVGAPGDAAHDGDPARVAAHHLHDHDPVVRLRRRVEPVDRLGRDEDRGIEAEGVVGRREVVVDRLRHSHDRELVLRVEPGGDAERVLAADRHQRVEALGAEVLEDALDAAVEAERVRPRRADDRPAARQEPRDLARPERRKEPVDEPAPALEDADHLVPARERPPRDRANDGVQAGTISASCEHSHAHGRLILGHGRRGSAASLATISASAARSPSSSSTTPLSRRSPSGVTATKTTRRLEGSSSRRTRPRASLRATSSVMLLGASARRSASSPSVARSPPSRPVFTASRSS